MVTNGAHQETSVAVDIPNRADSILGREEVKDVKEKWLYTLKDLNVCSQKGLVEMFDGSIAVSYTHLDVYKRQGIGSCEQTGICHSFSADGRCISLLKILFTNECIYDCKYCINRRTNDVRRASFTPDEVCTLTMEFYRRNYIEGLFLSSGILNSPDHTMELIYATLYRCV